VSKFLVALCYFGFLGGFAALCAVWAVVSLGRGEYLTAIVVLGLALSFVGIAVPVVLVMSGKVRSRAEFDADGTTIRCDRIVDRLNMWSTVAAVISMATYAIFAPLGKIDIPLPPGNHRNYTIFAIVVSLSAIPQLWKMFKRGGLSFIRLAPDGFELGQGISSVHGAWEEVVEIADRRPGKSPPFRATIFVKFRDGRTKTQAIDSFTPGGEALRKLVRYYWINPHRRDELVDGAAIDRLAGFEAD
jgi:hypothetical protein